MSAEEDQAEYDENELSYDVDDIDLDLEYQDNDSEGDDRNVKDPGAEKGSQNRPIERKRLGPSRSGHSRHSDRGLLYTRGAFRRKFSSDKPRVMHDRKDPRRDLPRRSDYGRKWDQGPRRIEGDQKSRLDPTRRIKDFRTVLDAARRKGEAKKDVLTKASDSRRWDIRPRSKEADLKSRERRSRSRDRRSRSRDRRSSSRGKRPRSRDRRSRSRDKNSRSRDRRSRSRDRRSRSRDRRSRSRDKRSRSKDIRSRSRDRSQSLDKRSCSKDKSSHSREKISQSRDEISQSGDKTSLNRDQTSRTRDKRSQNRDNSSRSQDNRSRSKDNTSQSLQKSSSSNKDDQSRERDRRADSQSKIGRTKEGRSTSREKRSTSRKRRSISRERRSDSQVRRSRSRENGSKTREKDLKSGERSNSKDMASKSRDRRSTSKDRRSLSRSRRSKSKDTGLRSRIRRSSSHDRRSRSRNRRSRSRNIGSNSRELSSKNRDRRSMSRDRRSRSRPRLRGRSLSRDRRSRSRDRRSRSLNKRRPIKRSRRRSGSSSLSSSSSRSRRSYSRGRRSKSRSPSVIAYKPRIELIDLEKYEENTARREGFRQQGTFDGGLLPTPGFTNQAPPSVIPFHSGGSGFNPPPPCIKVQFDQPIIHPQFAPNQPPPAPFISSHSPPEIPSTFLPGQPSGPQQFNQAPPPCGQPFSASQSSGSILIQPPVQFPPVSQPNEFGGYQVNTTVEYDSGYPLYESLPPHESHYPHPQAPSPPIIRRQPPPASRDYGGDGKWNSSLNKTSNLIYPGANSSHATPQKLPPKKSGVEEEMQNQKQTLVIQREQYLKKSAVLHKDLAQLKDQRSELLQDNLPETDRLLKENTKLQNEVNQRLKAIENVIEMLTGLIKKDQPEEEVRKFSTISANKKENRRSTPPPPAIRRPTEVDARPRAEEKDRSSSSRSDERSSPKRNKTPPRPANPNPSFRQTDVSSHKTAKTSPPPLVLPSYLRERSPKSVEPAQPAAKEAPPAVDTNPNQVNLVHYDPELHWCSLCNLFPKTAIDYLNHLHTPRHKQQIISLKLDSNPWHADEPVEQSPPFIKNAPVKRIPIRGVQFLVPSTGWYCRLCKTWIGDVHCASEHLKGRKHTTNYAEYISQNPHWEVDWMSDRTKSYERSSESLSRLRDKEESEEIPTLNTQLETEKAKFSALSDTLLAVLAQQNKRPRHTSSSSSTSSSDSHEENKKRSKKSKKKKSKKKKKKDQSPEKAPLTPVKVPAEKSVPVTQYRKKNNDESSPSNDNMITDWMEDDKIDSSISINLKNRFKQKVISNQVFEDRHQGDRNKEEDKIRREENKTKEGDIRHRDERSKEGTKSWCDRRDNRAHKEDSREQYNKREFRGLVSRERDRLNRDRKDDKFTKRNEPPKKKEEVLEDTSAVIPAKVEKKKSPIRVFQRPGDPSDRDSPEPVVFQERRDKKHDKPQGKLWFPSNKDDEEEETPFEKQAGESVIGKKKVEVKKITPFTMPKSKLPFIGRMPILKKKTIDFKSDDSNKDPKSMAAEKTLFWPNIPSAIEGPDPDKGVKGPKIVPKTPTINKPMVPDKPSPTVKTPVITVETKSKYSEDNLAEQDMEIANDDQDCIIWEDDQPKGKDELHPDFQDTLDLLFPEPGSDEKNSAITNKEKTKEKGDWSEIGNKFEQNKRLHGPGYEGQFEQNVYLGDLTQRPPGYTPINDGTLLIGPAGPPPLGQQGPLLGPPPGQHLGPPPGPHVGPPPGQHIGPPPGPHGLPPGPHGPPPGSRGGPLGPRGHGPPGPHIDPTGPHPNMHLPPPGPHIGPPGSHVGPHLGPPGPHLGPPGPPMGPPPGPPRGPLGPPLGHPGPPRCPPGPPPGLPPMARQMVGSMGPSLYDDLIEEPMQKRKNAPSQRMRRHLQKKRAQEAKTITEPSLPPEAEEKKTRYEGMDHADLAMLGIDEDDSIIA